MGKCAVVGCKNYQKKYKNNAERIRFHTFPRSPNLLNQWLNACGRDIKSFNVEYARVCFEHFSDDDWKLKDVLLNVPRHKRSLKEDAVPSRMLPYEPERTTIDEIHEKKLREELVKEAIESYDRHQTVYDNSMEADECSQDDPNTVGVQTEVDPECSKELQLMSLERENQKLKREKECLKKELDNFHKTYKSLNLIFTPGQVKRLKYPNRKTKWDSQDMEFALNLYSTGPKAYELLYRRNFPFPSPGTLRKWKKVDRDKESIMFINDNQVADDGKEYALIPEVYIIQHNIRSD